jgi:micrococcal nuclease
MKVLARAVVALAIIASTFAPVAHADDVMATVRRVIDGDTVDVTVASGKVERVRIIGLDTPETVDPRKPVQCFGREASARAKELLPIGSTVTLQGDPSQDARDRYGRVLAHVLVDASDGGSPSFAVRMIGEGFAHHYVYRVPSMYATEFETAQTDAVAGARGLWSPGTCAGQAYPKGDLKDDVAPTPVATPLSDLKDDVAPTPVATPFRDLNCSDFPSQAAAQAILRGDPTDPHRLDPDRDGLACESNRAPFDRTPVRRP